jgi:hypothetical protein
MKDICFAEWLLRRVMGRVQASSEVGDLFEVSQCKGKLWFWRAVISTLLYRSWRTTLAFAIAFGVGEIAATLSNSGIFGNVPDMNSVYTSGTLILAPLCIVPAFLLLRHGWRDSHCRLVLLFGLAAGVSLLYREHLVLRWTLPAVVVAALAVTLIRARRAWIPLQSLAQLGSGIAISIGGLILYFATLVSLWVVLSYWLNRPAWFLNVTTLLSKHPVHDLINALVALLIVRVADRQQSYWAIARRIAD